MYKYFPHTPEDIAGMLAKVGAESLEDLYAELPREVLYKGDYDLPSAMSEVEVRRFFGRLDGRTGNLCALQEPVSTTIMLLRLFLSS